MATISASAITIDAKFLYYKAVRLCGVSGFGRWPGITLLPTLRRKEKSRGWFNLGVPERPRP
jgi:hypothetical protein